MTPKRRLNRQETRRRSELATALVNFHSAKLDRFVDDHWHSLQLRFGGDKSAARTFLENLGMVLREAWDQAKWETAEQNLERIFAAQPGETGDWNTGISPLLSLGQMKRAELFLRPAFKIRLGRKLSRTKEPGPSFEPRDVLDEVAHAILRAGSLGLLRMCEGKKKGWRCPTPYVVADEGRRRFCYEACGDQAKAEAKKKPRKGVSR